MNHRTYSLFVIAGALLCVHAVLPEISKEFSGRLLKDPPLTQKAKWAFFAQDEIEAGATFPAKTNVVFTLPDTLSPTGSINRDVLFGDSKYEPVNYWGYCFPEGGPKKADPNKLGPPGEIFMSLPYRMKRAAEMEEGVIRYTGFTPPRDASSLTQKPTNVLQASREFFNPDETCYFMADHEVSVGSDLDGDDLNNKLETDNGTDPESEDTDGDGIMDGVEILRGLTNPLIVDSDGDGLPDGTEDYDADGRVDLGETDPNNMDSDGDGLCDGYCPFGFSNRLVCAFDETGDCVDFSPQFSMFKEDPEDPESISIIETRWYAGEDKNANRVVDSGETDPTKIATFTDSETGDPILDLEIFFQCALSGGGEIIDC